MLAAVEDKDPEEELKLPNARTCHFLWYSTVSMVRRPPRGIGTTIVSSRFSPILITIWPPSMVYRPELTGSATSAASKSKRWLSPGLERCAAVVSSTDRDAAHRDQRERRPRHDAHARIPGHCGAVRGCQTQVRLSHRPWFQGGIGRTCERAAHVPVLGDGSRLSCLRLADKGQRRTHVLRLATGRPNERSRASDGTSKKTGEGTSPPINPGRRQRAIVRRPESA